MPAGARTFMVEPLAPSDVVSVAQCIAIDADAFPYPSTLFGMRASSARVWAAREGGDAPVVGFVAGRVRRGVLHLEGLAVEREVRRRGIGRALVRQAVEHVREQGMQGIALHVSVANHVAISLYEGEGFVIGRRLPGFYPAAAF